MSLLYRIIYAAHANGTHHKLALDALLRLRHPQAEAWQRVFLKHAALYMEGSKDPDNKFKDFKNHVLHVRDNYWGGAPEKVQNWYQHVIDALKAQNWSEAVYAAGVLSHYYTDPIHPFHTAQTEAESNIHRAVEWSINRSYDGLREAGEKAFTTLAVPVPTGADWLREMTLNGADYSNRSYEKLIAHYDITRGVVDPPAGLDPVGRVLVSELLIYAATGFARILDKAFEECGQTPPDVSLTLDTILATVSIPAKALQKRLSNAADRALVQQMYDELKTTGRVDKTLTEDDRTVRDLYAAEVLAPRETAAARARGARLLAVPAKARRARPLASGALPAPPAPAHGADAGVPVMISNATAVAALEDAVLTAERACAAEAEAPEIAAGTADVMAPPAAANDEGLEPERLPVRAERPDKIYLAVSDDIEKAPSIGPKTAQRLAGVGVATVADFLEEDAEQLATMLGRRALTAKVLKDWQDQARLVMAVPGLRGSHAQLLVGAGYRDVAALATADADVLCADIARFVTTSDGQSILRDGDAPDIAKIKGWVDRAVRAIAA